MSSRSLMKLNLRRLKIFRKPLEFTNSLNLLESSESCRIFTKSNKFLLTLSKYHYRCLNSQLHQGISSRTSSKGKDEMSRFFFFFFSTQRRQFPGISAEIVPLFISATFHGTRRDAKRQKDERKARTRSENRTCRRTIENKRSNQG